MMMMIRRTGNHTYWVFFFIQKINNKQKREAHRHPSDVCNVVQNPRPTDSRMRVHETVAEVGILYNLDMVALCVCVHMCVGRCRYIHIM